MEAPSLLAAETKPSGEAAEGCKATASCPWRPCSSGRVWRPFYSRKNSLINVNFYNIHSRLKFIIKVLWDSIIFMLFLLICDLLPSWQPFFGGKNNFNVCNFYNTYSRLQFSLDQCVESSLFVFSFLVWLI